MSTNEFNASLGSSWYTPSNWSSLSVPGSSTTVEINGVLDNGKTCEIAGGTANAASVAIDGGGQLLVDSGALLDVQGQIIVGGNGVIGSGELIVNTGAVVKSETSSALSIGALGAAGELLFGGVTGSAQALGTGGVNSNLALGSGSAVRFNTTDDASFGFVISGGGSFRQQGSGTTVTLTGANSYSGTTTIDSGATLRIGNGGSTGAIGTGAVIDNGALDFDRGDSTTVANQISGTGSIDQFNGTTTLTAANTYSGRTLVSSGVLKGGAANAISKNSASVFVGSRGTLDLDGFNEQISNLSGAGTIDNSGSTSVTLTVSTSTDSLFSGLIENTGKALSLTKTGTATLTLTASNTYTGGTTVSAGTLTAGGSGDALGTGAVVNNATLILAAGATFGNAISGAGAVSIQNNVTLTGANTYAGGTTIAANFDLAIGNGGTSGSLGTGAVSGAGALIFNRSDSLTVANAISGAGIVEQFGLGTTILSGANTYTGRTFVFGGTLKGGAANAFSANTASVTVLVGAFLDIGGFNQSVVDLQGPGTVNNSGGTAATLTEIANSEVTFSGVIENTGGSLGLTKAGTGTWFLAGANTYTGATTVNAGVLTAASATAFGSNSAVTVASAGTLNLQGHSVTIGSLRGSGIVENLGGAAGTTLTIAPTGSTSAVFSGVIENGNGGALNVTISSGAATFSGANTYTGTTTIIGTLFVGDGSTTGTLGTGAVVDNGALIFNRGDTATIANTISGTGFVDELFGGTTILSAANTYTGGSNIVGGTLEIASGGSAGTGAISFGFGFLGHLRLDATPVNGSTFANTIDSIAADDTIDLSGLAFVQGATSTVSGSTLTVTSGATTEKFTLSNASGMGFYAKKDAASGTLVTAEQLTFAHVGLASDLSQDIKTIDLESQASGGVGTNYEIDLTPNTDLSELDDLFAVNLKGSDIPPRRARPSR